MYAALILAAGKGKRMKSDIPKVLHKALGKTLLEHVISKVVMKNFKSFCVVSPLNHESIKKYLDSNTQICIQENQKGTADAVKSAMPYLKKNKIKSVLVIPGDMPLIKKETIKKLFKLHLTKNNKITLLTGELSNPKGYGRIIRDKSGKILSIIEEKDLKNDQKSIREINTGVYIFEVDFLENILDQISPNNAQNEFYLTDSIKIVQELGEKQKKVYCTTLNLGMTNESMGVNSRQDLSLVIKALNKDKIETLMENGVTIEDPDSTYIDDTVKIGKDTVIKPFSIISGKVLIGKNCEIGPFAHIRDGVVLKDGACVGNYVEVKKTIIGKGSKAKHLTYLGNAIIGDKVNIGAGTITANYDGVNKHNTYIKNGCKIGSNTVIVAPNTIEKNVKTAAGCIIKANTKMPPNSLLAGVPARIVKRDLTDIKK